jgi:ATP-binding cassette subfamily B protein/subfamily B ATP-binding cassette protein MsbA
VAANLRSELSQHQFQVGIGAITAAGASIVMVVGGMAVLKGAMTIGDLLVLTAYFAAVYSPIETLAYLSEAYASAAAGARRVLEVLDASDCRIRDQPDAESWPPGDKGRGVKIELDQVTFGYQPGRPVLHEISLTIEAGEKVALVGRTGAGKSTLISLIPRFLDVWSGSVRVAGKDVRRIQLANLREHIAVVTQESFLLPLTIAQNIAYGRPDAAREEIVAAAVAAEADEFIRRLPNGYDTVIGERGATLSGGERQRLSIARALLKNAPILILDEPTSAIDVATECSVMEALAKLMEGRTTVMIAHRFSTLRRADRVIVLEHGSVVERGTHDELLSLRGRYYDLSHLQDVSQHQPPAPVLAHH